MVGDAIVGLWPVRPGVADVGAGTGIWSQMLYDRGCRVDSVEPNDAMRTAGAAQRPELTWIAGSAEETTLGSDRYDLVCMASSFHWPDFDKAVAEFRRLLKTGGYFAALWNTRDIVKDPLLEDIEAKLHELSPQLQRVSSGRSEFTSGLNQRLENCGSFSEVVYLEGHHVEFQTPEHYIGLWKSVNDIQVQIGREKFEIFLDYIRRKTQSIDFIKARYKTRCWLAKREG